MDAMCSDHNGTLPPLLGLTGNNNTDTRQNLAYRMRVMFIGDRSSGKSSLVKSLKTGNAQLVTMAKEGATTELWYPFQAETEDTFKNGFSEEERMLCLELWEQSGSKISRKCQDLSMTSCCLYVIVFNMAEETAADVVEEYTDAIQNKAADLSVIIVGTHADMIEDDGHRQEKILMVEDILKKRQETQAEKLQEELYHLEHLVVDSTKVSHYRQNVVSQLKSRNNLKTNIVCTSAITGKGLGELQRMLITTALDGDMYPHMRNALTEKTTKLYNEIDSVKKHGTILLTLDTFKEIACSCEIQDSNEMLNALAFMRDRGVISYPVECLPETTRLPSIICINPVVIQDVLCALHFDDSKKDFKFEAKRFWPKGNNSVSRPDAAVLVRAIEEIPTQGIIRESLFPLILQKHNLSEEQILLLLKYLIRIGILVRKEVPDKMGEFGCLKLCLFPSLSTQQHYYITLLEMIPDIEPRLNWTASPFPGDLEIALRYDFPLGTPHGFGDRLMTIYRQGNPTGLYQHHWRHGFLSKSNQVLVHLTYTAVGESAIVFTARITVDEEGEEKATEILWVELANVLVQADIYIAQWPGLLTKVFIQPGSCYFDDDGPDVVAFIPLVDCFNFIDDCEDTLEISIDERAYFVNLRQVIPLTDDNTLNIQQWLVWLASKEIEKAPELDDFLQSIEIVGAGQLRLDSKMAPKKKGRIKWDLDDVRNEETIEMQKVAAQFVANVLAQSITRLTEENEQTKHDIPGGPQFNAFDNGQRTLPRERPMEAVIPIIKTKTIADSMGKKGRSERAKSPVKSKTCILL